MNAAATAASETTPLERGLTTVSIMLATIMQALDTTIANVALPHMQGSMAATQDQISWVLTSDGLSGVTVWSQEAVSGVCHRVYHCLHVVRGGCFPAGNGCVSLVARCIWCRVGSAVAGSFA